MPEQLLQATLKLTESVERLEATLHEYPKRSEVEDRFATKHESKRRAIKVLALGLVMMLIALAVSFVVTIATVTTCFISDNARDGHAADVCNLLPGYEQTQQESVDLRGKIKDLLAKDKIQKNSQRLDRIEEELGLPPLPEKGN